MSSGPTRSALGRRTRPRPRRSPTPCLVRAPAPSPVVGSRAAQGAGGPDPGQVVLGRGGSAGRLGDHGGGERQCRACGVGGFDMQGHGSGGHPGAGCDHGEGAGGPVGEAVVVEHDPDPVKVQWTEHPVRQLRYHLGGRHPGQRVTVTHTWTVPGLADSTTNTGGPKFQCMLDQSVYEH